ncbi:hypothetical protein GCM10025767_27530 [Thalassotalea piscium]|uniref:diguanylate cyclase n=1 Tax=Thalassotalea piscium TaxID=1230533 RepID=A0A7X0TUS5_9GAMM|nr:diguanylate cyclase (GGDEF)-like protein [Thalassotalea piscium]
MFESCLPRATDVCARYGGEEFAIILTGTNTLGAEQVAENIRKKVEAHIVKYNQQEMRLTVSIGLVSKMLKTFDKNIPTELFKSADEALYNAKTKSRNCVVISANSAIN